MPAFDGFHEHGPFSSLRKNDWKFAKAIVGWAQHKWGTKIIISKQKSKNNFCCLSYIYITSTNVGASAVSAGENGADSPNLRPQGPALSVERKDQLSTQAIGQGTARSGRGA